jgi:hypothetical protein
MKHASVPPPIGIDHPVNGLLNIRIGFKPYRAHKTGKGRFVAWKLLAQQMGTDLLEIVKSCFRKGAMEVGINFLLIFVCTLCAQTYIEFSSHLQIFLATSSNTKVASLAR